MSETPPRLSRATARRLVAAIALVTLALNLWHLRAGLPAVLHSDYVQPGQAVDLLATGRVEDRAIYPLPLVYAYAAADVAAYAVGHVLGWTGYADWPTFITHLQRVEVHHAIGRALGAVCAAITALGLYRLARVRFDRRVAVLACAVASFSPLQTVYAHQVRPHIPVIMVAVLVAPAVLRFAFGPSPRRALLAGAGTGLVSAVFPVGLPYFCSVAALAVLYTRPWRALPRVLLALGAGFAPVWVGVTQLTRLALAEGATAGGLVARGEGGKLGYGIHDLFSHVGRFPRLGPLWLAAEPMCALGTLAFIGLCIAKRRSWKDVVAHGLPAIAMPMGVCLVHVARPRYTMYMTPFLAPLAASAVLALPQPLLRRALAALLVLVPLASSVRYDHLMLGRTDTRLALSAWLEPLSSSGLRVVAQADIVPSLVALPRGVMLFPPDADYRVWMTKSQTPLQTFMSQRADVFARRRDAPIEIGMNPEVLQRMGYVLAAQLGADTAFVPDDPGWVLPELWQADRAGPPMDFWVLKPHLKQARKALSAHLR
jgi:hypothetical protein